MKKTSAMLCLLSLIGMLFATSGVMAYDASNPYTVTMNFIVGDDTSFTVSLAGEETTIDFNPATLNSKEVEPDSQNAGTSIQMIEITNTGNVNLDFNHAVNASLPNWVIVSYNTANTVDWTKTLNETSQTFSTSVAPAGTVDVYFWANFTSADSGTESRTYQINSTASA